MTSVIEGLPADVVQADLPAGSISFLVDAATYPLEAVYGASYVFIDRCYVLLDRPETGKIRVSLAPKKGSIDADTLRGIVGEFGNELLGCAWRAQITQQNRPVIEALTTQALSGAMGAPSLEDLASFDFTEESFSDPLGIAMSWEDKYKKKSDVTAGAPAAEDGKAAPSGEGSGA